MGNIQYLDIFIKQSFLPPKGYSVQKNHECQKLSVVKRSTYKIRLLFVLLSVKIKTFFKYVLSNLINTKPSIPLGFTNFKFTSFYFAIS